MVFSATFNNISVISWRSVLLVKDAEKTTDLSQVTDKLYRIMLYTSPWSRFELTTAVVMGTDCIGSCKSNYLTITTTTAPQKIYTAQKIQRRAAHYVCNRQHNTSSVKDMMYTLKWPTLKERKIKAWLQMFHKIAVNNNIEIFYENILVKIQSKTRSTHR
jgi:hypothetical protein